MHISKCYVVLLMMVLVSFAASVARTRAIPVESAFLSPTNASQRIFLLKEAPSGTISSEQFSTHSISSSGHLTSPSKSPTWKDATFPNVQKVPETMPRLTPSSPSVLRKFWGKITKNPVISPIECAIFASTKVIHFPPAQLYQFTEPFVWYYSTEEGQRLTAPFSFFNRISAPIITDNIPCKSFIFTTSQIPSNVIARSAGVLFQIMSRYRSEYANVDTAGAQIAAAQVKAAIVGFNQGRGDISATDAASRIQWLVRSVSDIKGKLSLATFYDEVLNAFRLNPLMLTSSNSSPFKIGSNSPRSSANRYGITSIANIAKNYNCTIFTAIDVYDYEAKHLYHIVTPFVNYFISGNGEKYNQNMSPYYTYSLPCRRELFANRGNSADFSRAILYLFKSMEKFQVDYLLNSAEDHSADREFFALKMKISLLGFNVWRGSLSYWVGTGIFERMIPNRMSNYAYSRLKTIYDLVATSS